MVSGEELKPQEASYIKKFGEAAIGKELKYDFAGDVLIFFDPELPDGYALCMDKYPYNARILKENPVLGEGEEFIFRPVRRDGYTEPEYKTYKLDDNTRLVRRENMGSLPKMKVAHSTFNNLAALIQKHGLYTSGEAIVTPVYNPSSGYGPHFWGYEHEVAIIFDCPAEHLSYVQFKGEADGLAICHRANLKDIPPEVIRTVLVKCNFRDIPSLEEIKKANLRWLEKLATMAGLSYGEDTFHLGKEHILEVINKKKKT